MSKTKTAPAAPAAAAEEVAPPQPPRTGGCWIRNADGTLSRDSTEHPEQAEAPAGPTEE